jgi:glycosyltransferase involved in cell wall biosynthesis
VTVHDIIPRVLGYDPTLSTVRDPIVRWFDRRALQGLQKATALIAISRWTKQTIVDAIRVAPDRITVTHPGVDHDRYYPQAVPASFLERYGLQEGQPYLLYVGSEDPRKNLEVLWRAMPMITERAPDAVLLKVGASHNPPMRARLREIARELDFEGSVKFIDEVPETDLPLFYCTASVFIMPSLQEGFGLPILEAMACGTPVVSVYRPSLAEIVDDTSAIVVDAHDPQQLAAAVIRALNDEPFVAGLTERARSQAASFQWKEMIDRTLQVYAHVSGSAA